MTAFSYDDAAGQAILAARATQTAHADALEHLEAVVLAERDMFRAERERLLQRAENAESDVQSLTTGLLNAQQAARDVETERSEIEAELERRADQVIGYQQSLSERNARVTALEAKLTRIGDAVRASEVPVPLAVRQALAGPA